jgi:hypothetical protein
MVTEKQHRLNMKRISDSIKASDPYASKNTRKQRRTPRARKKSKPIRKLD